MSKFKKKEFDAYANEYRDILQENIKKLSGFGEEYFSEYKVQIVKNSLNKIPENILDFGCGDGISCQFFRKHFLDTNLIGVDVSSESIKVAEAREISNSSFVHYEGNELPFESYYFDVIFVACVFHHIEKNEHANLINEFKRVLKKGGKLFIFEHNPINPLTRKVVKDCIFDKDAELIYAEQLKNSVINSGFEKAKINYTLFFPRYNFFKKLFSMEKYFTKCPIGAQYYLEATKFD